VVNNRGKPSRYSSTRHNRVSSWT